MSLCRKLVALLAVVSALILLQGCWVTFVYPIGRYEDALIDTSLDGNWFQPESECNLLIEAPGTGTRNEPEDWKLYELHYSSPSTRKQTDVVCLIEPGHQIQFSGVLLQVGKNRFFQLKGNPPLPGDSEPGPCVHGGDYSEFCVELYSILKLVKNGDGSISLIPPSYAWFEQQLKDGTLRLDATHDILITNNTAKLREFLIANGDDPKVFSPTMAGKPVWRFVRQK
jgi:hypothetical protein